MAGIDRRACLRFGLVVAPLALSVSGLPALAAVPPPEVAEAERYMSLLVNTARKDHGLGTLALERNLAQAEEGLVAVALPIVAAVPRGARFALARPAIACSQIGGRARPADADVRPRLHSLVGAVPAKA